MIDFWTIAWIAASAAAGWIAAEKGRSGGLIFLLSLIATPLVGIVVALALDNRDYIDRKLAAQDKSPMRICPACGSLIRREAMRCPQCRTVIEQAPPQKTLIE